MNFVAGWQCWPFDHHNRQAEGSCRGEFGRGPFAAGIFTHDALDALRFQQGEIALQRKRASINHGADIWQWRRAGRPVNQTQHVMVLGLGGKGRKVYAANGEQHSLGRARQGADGFIDTCHALPLVALNGLPGGPGKSDGLYAALCRSG